MFLFDRIQVDRKLCVLLDYDSFGRKVLSVRFPQVVDSFMMFSVGKKKIKVFLRILFFKDLEHALQMKCMVESMHICISASKMALPWWEEILQCANGGGFLGGCVGPLLKVHDRISCPL